MTRPSQPAAPSGSDAQPPTRADAVLIVEDDTDIRDDLAAVLRAEGYAVMVAANGVTALELLRDGPRPALILLDLMMPDMNGWEFRATQLRDPALASIPVVLLTSWNQPAVDTAALRADACLSKPFEVEAVTSIVARYCQSQRRS